MAPRLRRPEVNATINICSRTFTGEQSAAIQVAQHQSFQLIHAKSQETIPNWAAELELDILVGFGIDPRYYTVCIHDLTPAHEPCPKEHELKTLKDVGIDQIATGPYEVHFVLRDGIKAPTAEALREWQQRWVVAVADPSPAPVKHMFTICNSLKHMATLSVDSLQTPPEGDVERAMRHELGLSCAEETIKHQLGRALRMNLSGKQVFFHLNGEACASQRDISELITTTLAQNNIVKVHVPSITGVGTLAVGSGGDESGDGETDEG
jgi:hypothetical protein